MQTLSINLEKKMGTYLLNIVKKAIGFWTMATVWISLGAQ